MPSVLKVLIVERSRCRRQCGAIYSSGEITKGGLHPRGEISNSTISANIAASSGGGIDSNGDGDLILTNVNVTGNVAHDAAVLATKLTQVIADFLAV